MIDRIVEGTPKTPAERNFVGPPSSYQLAFTIPGIKPWFAISRKQSRESLNFLRNPRALPVNWHRFLRRTGEEFLGNLLSESTAARRSSIGFFISRMIALNFDLLSKLLLTNLSRFFCFAMEDFFAILIPYFLRPGPF